MFLIQHTQKIRQIKYKEMYKNGMGSVKSVLRQFKEDQDCYQEYQNNKLYEFVENQKTREYHSIQREKQRDSRNKRLYDEIIDLLKLQSKPVQSHSQSLNIGTVPRFTTDQRYYRSQSF
jgi:hypothetical protein